MKATIIIEDVQTPAGAGVSVRVETDTPLTADMQPTQAMVLAQYGLESISRTLAIAEYINQAPSPQLDVTPRFEN